MCAICTCINKGAAGDQLRAKLINKTATMKEKLIESFSYLSFHHYREMTFYSSHEKLFAFELGIFSFFLRAVN